MTCPRDALARQRLQRLRHALQALAAPAEDALAVYPEVVCRVDELAMDLGHWLDVTRSHGGLRAAELELLEGIDGRLRSVSRADQAHLWTEEALRHHPFWRLIREEAGAALDRLGWPRDLPPPSPDTFLPAGG